MSTIVIQCNSGDCWADKAGNFSATGSELYVIDSPGVTNSNVRTWIPFTVPLRNVTVQQAYITIRPNASQSGDGTIKFSCEASDNPGTPVSAADLNSRPLSSYQTDILIGNWAADTNYTYQIDNPIQETLQRPGWQAGNTLAVIIDDVDFGENQRSIYSHEGNASYRAYLTINYIDFTPVGVALY
jgi:hypothetical protein